MMLLPVGGDLTIVLFLGSLVATFGVAAIGQAGWKNRLLWGLTLLSLAAAVSWSWVKEKLPIIEGYTLDVAASPISWFVVVMCLVVVALLPRPRSGQAITHAIASPGGFVSANTKPDAMRIELGSDSKHERVESFPNGFSETHHPCRGSQRRRRLPLRLQVVGEGLFPASYRWTAPRRTHP
jgi:hypothetical protein